MTNGFFCGSISPPKSKKYGYSHSKRNSEDIFDENGRRYGVRLRFPRQIVIYLNPAGYIPDEYLVNIIFNDEKEIKYYIPTIKFQNESLEQIREKHMTRP